MSIVELPENLAKLLRARPEVTVTDHLETTAACKLDLKDNEHF